MSIGYAIGVRAVYVGLQMLLDSEVLASIKAGVLLYMGSSATGAEKHAAVKAVAAKVLERAGKDVPSGTLLDIAIKATLLLVRL